MLLGVSATEWTQLSSGESKDFCEALVVMDKYNGQAPAIYGDEISVPGFRIRLLDSKTNKPVVKQPINITYAWEWLEYLDGVQNGGEWRDAYDWRACVSDEDGAIVVPAYTVRPKGWYAGDRLKGKRPRFTELGVSAGSGNVYLKKGDLSRIRGSFKPFLMSREDGFIGMYRYEISPVK